MRGILMVVAAVALASATSLRAQAATEPASFATTAAAQVDGTPLTPTQAAPGVMPRETPPALSRLGPSSLGAQLLAPAVTRSTAEQRTLAHTPVYRHQPGLALMIVGGALFLGGAIIEGDAGTALMVGGVVVGAVGLYEYLQ